MEMLIFPETSIYIKSKLYFRSYVNLFSRNKSIIEKIKPYSTRFKIKDTDYFIRLVLGSHEINCTLFVYFYKKQNGHLLPTMLKDFMHLLPEKSQDFFIFNIKYFS